MSVVIDWAERSVVPDALIRVGIRRIVAGRLKEEWAGGAEAQLERYQHLMRCSKRATLRGGGRILPGLSWQSAEVQRRAVGAGSYNTGRR